MRTLGMVLVFICAVTFIIIGAVLIALALNLLSVQGLTFFLRQSLQLKDIHMIIGGIGLFIILASIFIAQITLGKMQREKTIAFDNPSGQVTVSLQALEDFVKRLSLSMAEVKDLRCHVIAGKRGIEVHCRVSLWADTNIPQSTEHIQSVIKSRVQEMLGIEDPIVVRVHVGKIVPKEKEKKRLKKKDKDEPEETAAPFQGSFEYGKD